MLDSKQCEAFFAVAETGSFDLASEQLCITASAVTQRVQALEKNLGQILLIRARPCSLTKAGIEVLAFLRHARLLEQNLLQNLHGEIDSNFYAVSIASNADSLATWLLPALSEILIKERIVLDIKLDDQSHTYSLLEKGIVNACISIEPKAMTGCKSIFLGSMQYKMLATPIFIEKYFKSGITREQLKQTPAIIFNDKDQIHFDAILKLFGLVKGTYPCSFIPSSDSFVSAIEQSLGYGMIPTIQVQSSIASGKLVEILPEACINIPLYWHHWNKQTAKLDQLTEHLLLQAKKLLF
ncbi:LysR family transcriptional regulator ArgP [Acinetobacter gerneri]|uniref:HTH lysR-type domain-containing protein n=1 Tax=Acinetobacter gerneri DSM 14967 = CIP 107464 = MTCC 9824 TaxID=1120926 RepID=N8ZQN3_9GAMM|nr:LysR family transcriptional regulator ArgP [Acinetobacter gerneri]ENV34048.1 hypothetical protein F960_01738 [Acinetobacter gerneri DSM 14967 = CIP 107464 = MTCC 9824]EPR84130.1 Chromosome initiation inhibitor [Acinetobacter gerneri DSM 14967 = CIP 107464 = MTCC 9824]